MITINKAKIKNSMLHCEFTEPGADGFNKVSKECTSPVHEDMVHAFKMLDIHLALLCQQVIILRESNEEDEEKLLYTRSLLELDDNSIADSIRCTGYSIGGSDEHEGVTLIGCRELTTGRILNLVSPFQKWDDEFTPYDYGWTLKQIVNRCNSEVQEYLLAGKCAPSPQL